MIVVEESKCPNCLAHIEEEDKFCSECGTVLEYDSVEEAESTVPKHVVRHGTIDCKCGNEFYFETIKSVIECVYCKALHDTSGYPIKEGSQEDVVEERPLE